MTKAISSWSGGKDSGFACYLAQRQGYDVTHLVNFISKESRRVSFHGTRAHLVSRQAQAARLRLAQYAVPPDMALYERTFKRAAMALKRRGAEAMVFGDIYLDEHREWVERVCSELGLKPVLPLWGRDPEGLLKEFIDAGFEAVVVSAKAQFFGEEWVGRRVDHAFLSDLKGMVKGEDVDVCGEKGEYHTVLVDGPLFQERLEVTRGTKVLRDGYWFLDMPRCRAIPKLGLGAEAGQ
jgi:diphthine-ammonia ligase